MKDPRVDPRPGDVLVYGPQWQQERVKVNHIREGRLGPYVIYEYSNGASFMTDLDGWRRLMRDAEVLHVAE